LLRLIVDRLPSNVKGKTQQEPAMKLAIVGEKLTMG